ncbi:MAG: hypothetical protein QOK43_154 [Acidimicrobiaceae bacterium]|nr:hypothetical protein [Acidimicrobiaceae bacterium]
MNPSTPTTRWRAWPRSPRPSRLGVASLVALLSATGLVLVPAPASAATGTLAFNPGTLAFGSVRVGTGSQAQSITVQNTDANNSVTISSVSIEGLNPNDFVAQTDCVGTIIGTGAQSPKTLGPNETCSVAVKSVPIAVGGRSAQVSVKSDGSEPDKRATVSATGTEGYYLAGQFGEVQAFGDAVDHGDATGVDLNAPIVDMATTQTNGDGYWLLGLDGGVFSYNAKFFGSTGGMPLNQPVVAMSAVPLTDNLRGDGYWFVALDGGVFAYGEAAFKGSMGGKPLNEPVIGMVATPSGNGYWLVASDGGIFAFGDAGYFGSMGGKPLNEPIAGMAAMPDGSGYWLVALDGGIFAFGNAPYKGSTGGIALKADIVDMWPSPTGNGYWLAASDGEVFNFGDAPHLGDLGGGAVDDAIALAGTAPPLSPYSEGPRVAF